MAIIDQTWVNRLRLLSMYGIACTLAFSLLNLNSIFIILLAFVWLLEGKFMEKWTRLKRNPCFWAFAIYFLTLIPGLMYAHPIKSGWEYLEGKVGFLVLPLLICSWQLDAKDLRKIMLGFLIFLTLASLYCIAARLVTFAKTGDTSIFFYHNLVQPIEHHAVYFSVFLFVATAFFIKHINADALRIHKWVKVVWVMYCVLLLILLSSKLVLLFLLVYLIYTIFSNQFRRLQKKYKIMGIVLVCLLIIGLFTIDNPVKKRFGDMLSANTELLKNRFDRATYFNGVEFRLLLWRISFEILDETNSWILGVGPTNAQQHLNKKYAELDLYSGPSASGDAGYFVYNCHNEFLQTAVQSGLIGLTALLFLVFILLVQSFRTKDEVIISFILLLLCFFLVESVFERQYGVLLVAWLPLLFLNSQRQQKGITRTISST